MIRSLGRRAGAWLLPRRLVRLILLELRLGVALVRWLGGRHDGRRPASFGYARGLAAMLWTIFGLVVVEGAVVELVLAVAVPGTPWPWVSLAVHGYALLWLAALCASFVTRPHLLTERGLLLRDGPWTEITVPLRAVRSVRPELRGILGRSGLTVEGDTGLLAHGDATVRLTLDPEVPVDVVGHPPVPGLSTLYVTVDDAAAFVRALQDRLVGLQWVRADGRGGPVAGS